MRPLSALLAAAVLLASACGEDDRSAGASRGNSVDRAFIAGMVPHHEMGVEMARMAAADASSQAIVALARDMVRVQSREIDDMRWLDGELERDGVRRGDLGLSHDEMGMGHDMDALGRARRFDREWIAAMVPHHQGALRMVRAELRSGADERVKALARAILATQAHEIRWMRAHRTDVHGGRVAGRRADGRVAGRRAELPQTR